MMDSERAIFGVVLNTQKDKVVIDWTLTGDPRHSPHHDVDWKTGVKVIGFGNKTELVDRFTTVDSIDRNIVVPGLPVVVFLKSQVGEADAVTRWYPSPEYTIPGGARQSLWWVGIDGLKEEDVLFAVYDLSKQLGRPYEYRPHVACMGSIGSCFRFLRQFKNILPRYSLQRLVVRPRADYAQGDYFSTEWIPVDISNPAWLGD